MDLQINNTISSLEVAKMVDQNHKEVLRKIRDINKKIAKREIAPSDLWTESNYKDKSGKSNIMFLMTKKGCELYGHKLENDKGIDFTLAYIDIFNKMQEHIKQQQETLKVPQTYAEALIEAGRLAQENDKLVLRTKEVTDVLNVFQKASGAILVRDFIKIIHEENGIKIKEKQMWQLLRAKYLDHKDLPYAQYKKYFSIKSITKNGKIRRTTKISSKGQLYFANKLIKEQNEN